ncbi:hypothetical protein [Sinorhizobium sp. BG8]|uniref:hypothetical protein n=1 Tax=Sinorhizobium sp. BG8 TaxID=2613773 RepID=UPI00193C9A0E|nr:hypothetical protein [Sinorhizobium sp. BG8]QRM55812.1 hypothetical protein F3Y30_15710 [Sinorhizobium sp. BG8]
MSILHLTDHGTAHSQLELLLAGRFTPLNTFATRMIEAWRLYHAERQLEGLPFDVMKDIGFPALDDAGKNGARRTR